MKIKAVQFKSGTEDFHYKQIQFEVEAAKDLEGLKERNPCTAFVIKEEDIKNLLEFKIESKSLVQDLGTKNKAKQLSLYFIEKEKKDKTSGQGRAAKKDMILLIRGRYSKIGQLIRSIRDLLKNAFKDKNIYFIAVDRIAFNELWNHSHDVPSQGAKEVKREGGYKDFTEMIPPANPELEAKLAKEYIGDSKKCQTVRQLILKAADVKFPVLILGDTGTGKEIVARAIHNYSPRCHNSLVVVNCGAIVGELFEAELFGHTKGAFTGAHLVKKGYWRSAEDSTLFLDEIGDLRLNEQGKILRALEYNEIQPVGMEKEVLVNARVVAATNRNLLAMVQNGQFREDLYYRLVGITIQTPALRDHPEDIPVLAEHLWENLNKDNKNFLPLPLDILKELQSYPWPGNARDLKAVLTNFRANLKEIPLGLAHLRSYLQYTGRCVPDKTFGGSGGNGYRFFEHLNQIRRTEKAMKTSEMMMRPFLKETCLDQGLITFLRDSLQMQEDELEMLCNQPMLFQDNNTFSVVYQFKGKMVYFLGLLEKNPQEALQLWRKEVLREYNRTLEVLAKGTEYLLKNPI